MTENDTPPAPAPPGCATGARAIAGAATIVAVGLALAMDGFTLLPFVLIVTLGIGFAFGTPVFLLLRANVDIRSWKVGTGGFVTGALVPALLVLPGPGAQEASIGTVVTVADNHYTAAGWLQSLAVVGGFGVAGIVGALIAWLLIGVIAPLSAERRLNPWRGGALAALVAAAAAATMAIPWATMDRSCHNPMRDGRRSIAAVAEFQLRLPAREWPALRGELNRFAASQRWSIQSDVRTDPAFPWFQASLCTEPGTEISLSEIPVDGGYIAVDVFQPQRGDSWQAPLRALQRRLEARWPGTIRYADGPYAAPPPPWAPLTPTSPAQAK